jgi:hypothetical protein
MHMSKKATNSSKTTIIARTLRTTGGLCEALFEEFDMLRGGASDAQRAAAVAKLANQIMSGKRLEMEAAMLIKNGIRIRPVLLQANRRLGLVR